MMRTTICALTCRRQRSFGLAGASQSVSGGAVLAVGVRAAFEWRRYRRVSRPARSPWLDLNDTWCRSAKGPGYRKDEYLRGRLGATVHTHDMRDFDVVVYGASGFVGVLVARHLATAAPPGTRIALAGRSLQKLESVRSDLKVDWPVIVADAADTDALAELAGRTRVVATTVGPYAKYGRKLAHGCAAAGTDYVDLTGEVLFARASIDENDDARQPHRRPHRALVRLRLDPVRHRRPRAAQGGPRGRRRRPDRHHSRGHQHAGRGERRHDRLDAPPGRRYEARQGPAPAWPRTRTR